MTSSQLELPNVSGAPRYRLELVREDDTPYEPGWKAGDPQTTARFIAAQIGNKPQEHMTAIYLDTRLHVGLLLGAPSVIVAHNHPSGDPTPSLEDVAFTRRLADAGNVVGLQLVDHIIVGTPERWISLRQRGGW